MAAFPAGRELRTGVLFPELLEDSLFRVDRIRSLLQLNTPHLIAVVVGSGDSGQLPIHHPLRKGHLPSGPPAALPKINIPATA